VRRYTNVGTYKCIMIIILFSNISWRMVRTSIWHTTHKILLITTARKLLYTLERLIIINTNIMRLNPLLIRTFSRRQSFTSMNKTFVSSILFQRRTLNSTKPKSPGTRRSLHDTASNNLTMRKNREVSRIIYN